MIRIFLYSYSSKLLVSLMKWYTCCHLVRTARPKQVYYYIMVAKNILLWYIYCEKKANCSCELPKNMIENFLSIRLNWSNLEKVCNFNDETFPCKKVNPSAGSSEPEGKGEITPPPSRFRSELKQNFHLQKGLGILLTLTFFKRSYGLVLNFLHLIVKSNFRILRDAFICILKFCRKI